MSVLTDVVQSINATNQAIIVGTTLNTPELLLSDGRHNTYVVDVNIGRSQFPIINVLNARAGSADMILRQVPIANNNGSLRYTSPGSPVVVMMIGVGKWMVTGPGKIGPNSYWQVPVAIPDYSLGQTAYTVGTPEDVGIYIRQLTLGQLADYMGGFGFIPLGAVAVFKGTTLIEIRS